MAVIYLHDDRVLGVTPACDLPVPCQAAENNFMILQRLATEIRSNVVEPGWFNTLVILCHGTPDGLQLGSPNVSQSNVARIFAPLQGLVGTICLRACGAALTFGPGSGGTYDGMNCCRILAQTTHAIVYAADADQLYLSSNSIASFSNQDRLLPWRGRVGRWGPDGSVTRAQ
jgi:hypothetical protein